MNNLLFIFIINCLLIVPVSASVKNDIIPSSTGFKKRKKISCDEKKHSAFLNLAKKIKERKDSNCVVQYVKNYGPNILLTQGNINLYEVALDAENWDAALQIDHYLSNYQKLKSILYRRNNSYNFTKPCDCSNN